MARSEVAQTKTITVDDEHDRVRYLRSDMNTGSGMVQRRLQAERDGYKIKTFDTPADLPEHVQTKFAMMEKAANEAG